MPHELSDGTHEPLTVLEAVVKQTGIYAPSRKGRLSVYWGDQVFVPSAPFSYSPTHHIDIMCTLLGDTAPTAEEWAAQGLDKYGVIAVSKGEGRDAAQVEKVDHATAVKMLESLGDIGQVGPSLGSFSVSAAMLSALCSEYSAELAAKEGKFDTDPHFWMPLTLPEGAYVSLMGQKGVDASVSTAHHARMTKMKASFDLSSGMGLFGAVDVGSAAAWWDYGQVKLYFNHPSNALVWMVRPTDFANLRRRFSVGHKDRFDFSLKVEDDTVGLWGDVTDAVFIGDAATLPQATRGWPKPDRLLARRSPMPGYDAALGALTDLREPVRFLPNPADTCRSFSVFYETVKRQSRSLQSQLNGEIP